MQPTIDNENVAIVFGSMALFVLLFRIFMFGIPLMKKSFREKSVKKFFQSLTLMCILVRRRPARVARAVRDVLHRSAPSWRAKFSSNR